MKQNASLGEISLQLHVNKSKLAYYYSMGLLKPITRIGRMNIFNSKETINIIKKIAKNKKQGKKIKDIKNQNSVV